MPHAGDALLYRVVAKVERPLFPGYVLHGNHPSVPTCPFQDMQTSILTEGFLRSAAHEGVLRCTSIPNFHSASDRCRPPISYFVRSTRVRLVYLDANRCAPMFYCIKNTSRFVRCQPALCQKVRIEFLHVHSARRSDGHCVFTKEPQLLLIYRLLWFGNSGT
jgi:hypothetical protein